MEGVAKHDFTAENPAEELSFKKNDRLLILNYGDPVQWFEAELFEPGKKRVEQSIQPKLVPGNYISINVPSWYKGRVSRAVAERMLLGNKYEGAFLIRYSESSPTDFSLSVKCGESVQHFRILKADNEYFLWTERFPSLNKLVDHYRKETVSRSSQIFLKDMDTDGQWVAEALYHFEPDNDPQNEDVRELEFSKGDLIVVLDTSDDNWWVGQKVNNQRGYFPRTYVRPFDANGIRS